ncbi:MAG: PucR family transcriptional regulator [Actinomycetota bacterium]
MPITVRDLLDLEGLGLKLVAGKEGIDSPIRWAHISELQDPTPWLSGGELLLTTGMGLKGSTALQRAYIRRLVGASLAGLGFGVGFGFEEVPDPIVRAAEREGFPILEVPYPVPFIAITEAISSRLAEDRVKEAQLSVEVHERLASLVSEGSGPADVLDEVVALAGGWAILFDLKGEVLARTAPTGGTPEAQEVWAGLPSGLTDTAGTLSASDIGRRGTRVALAVMVGKRHEAVLVFGKESRLEQRDHIVVHHAMTVLGLLLASRRAVIETERRVAGDILSEAFAGRIAGPDLGRRLELAGFAPGAPLCALIVETPSTIDSQVLDDLAWAADAAFGRRCKAVRTSVISGRIVVLVSHEHPEKLAGAVLRDVARAANELRLTAIDDARAAVRIGVGRSVDASNIRTSYLTALFALRAAPGDREVATARDLGSYAFLLETQSRPALESFVGAVLEPLLQHDEMRSSELVRSMRAFIEAGGRWEQGAEVLGVHRHTLRYRIRKAEELLGRDLSRAEDRLEVWLALKAAEILEA